jgi:hypothetical protein
VQLVRGVENCGDGHPDSRIKGVEGDNHEVPYLQSAGGVGA